jgi:hypothetical protein
MMCNRTGGEAGSCCSGPPKVGGDVYGSKSGIQLKGG